VESRSSARETVGAPHQEHPRLSPSSQRSLIDESGRVW
jgi:hypothetical protein